MEKLKLHKNSQEYKQLKRILDHEVLGMRAKLLQKTIDEAHALIEKIDNAGTEDEKNKLFKRLQSVKNDLLLYWYGLNSFSLIYELLTNGNNMHDTLYNEAKEAGLKTAFEFSPFDIAKLKY